MKKLLSLLLIVFIIFGCSDNKNNQSGPSADNSSTKDSTQGSFFPVTSFLKGQMRLLDSMQITFLQVTTAANKADSAWIPREKIRPLLQPFIADLIDKENLTSFFKESKFNDQSTDAITFTYDPKTALPDSISLRRWVVYVNPETGNVKRVYILKQLKANNQVYTQQLTWQTDKWAKLVTILNKPGGNSEIQNDMKLIWDLSINQ